LAQDWLQFTRKNISKLKKTRFWTKNASSSKENIVFFITRNLLFVLTSFFQAWKLYVKQTLSWEFNGHFEFFCTELSAFLHFAVLLPLATFWREKLKSDEVIKLHAYVHLNPSSAHLIKVMHLFLCYILCPTVEPSDSIVSLRAPNLPKMYSRQTERSVNKALHREWRVLSSFLHPLFFSFFRSYRSFITYSKKCFNQNLEAAGPLWGIDRGYK